MAKALSMTQPRPGAQDADGEAVSGHEPTSACTEGEGPVPVPPPGECQLKGH